jgi:hypothetical protein
VGFLDLTVALAMDSSHHRSPKRRAEGRLNRLILQQTPVAPALPLVHITRAYAFDEILEGDTLDPKECGVFKEQLTYLFYGRPAYRAKDGNNARLEFEWPIVFIFDPQRLSAIRRLFPFDTGAFALGIYDHFFAKDSRVEDFVLDPTLDAATKIVGALYVNNEEYYLGGTRKNVDIPHRQFELQGLYELARLPGIQGASSMWQKRDERSSAIEIQFDQPLPLTDTLIAVILPKPYMDDSDIKDALQRWRVKEIETYGTIHNIGGEAWVGQIYAIVQRLYDRLGYFK